jgi:hypothetical protein
MSALLKILAAHHESEVLQYKGRKEWKSNFSGEKPDYSSPFRIIPAFFVFFAFSRGQLRFQGSILRRM